MSLITLERAEKHFGARTLFADVNLTVHPDDRIGLIGINGSGKTTLIGALCGDVQIDTGERRARRGLRIAVLEQLVDGDDARTAWSVAAEGASAARAVEAELREIESSMATETEPTALTDLATRHADATARFERHGGPGYERFIESALSGLGVPRERWHEPLASMSSGQRVRVRLARLLQRDAELLLLDEPTNHLDIDAIEWLADHLRKRPGALLVVSHDRYFLDRVVTRIVEIDQGRVHTFAGNYSAYLPQRAHRIETAQRAWERQDEMIRKNEDFVRRSGHGNKPGVAQSRKKMLEKVVRLERPTVAPTVRVRLPDGTGTIREPLVARGVSFAHPGGAPLFEGLSLHVRRGDRIAIVGPNGSGKTTFLRLLAGGIAPTAGEVWRAPKLVTATFDQDLAEIDSTATLVETVMRVDPAVTENEARGHLGSFGFSGDDVFRSTGTLSGGERGRLGLLCTLVRGGELLFLDEPTNHLDIFTRESLLEALDAFAGTVVIVTHDRHLLSAWARRIVRIDGARSVVRESTYDEFVEWAATPVAVPAAPARPKPAAQPKPAPAAPKKKRRFWKLEDLEAAIIEREEEHARLQAQFADPAVARDGERTKALKAAVQALEEELASLQEEWEGWA